MDNKIDKVIKRITQIGDMVIEHQTNVQIFDKRVGKFNPVIKVNKNSTSKAGVNGLSSVYIGNSYDKIVLKSNKDAIKTDENWVPPPAIIIGYGDFNNFKIFLDEIKSWFEIEEYRNNLFNYSTDGVPIQINSKYKDLGCRFKSHSYFINDVCAARPFIVTTTFGTDRYPGVEFRGKTGIIGCCTYSEFYELRFLLLDLLKNLYQNSLNLSILGGLYSE